MEYAVQEAEKIALPSDPCDELLRGVQNVSDQSSFYKFRIRKSQVGTGEMTLRSRAFVALSEDLSSALSTHIMAHNHLVLCELMSYSDLRHQEVMCYTHIHIGKIVIHTK